MQNTVFLIGHLGSDVKIKEFDNGGCNGAFSLATNDSYTNAKGEKVENTQWHNIVVSGEFAKTCEKYIKKGSLVQVSGKLSYRSYEKDNEKHYVTEIIAREVLFLDKKQNNTSN